MAMWVQVILLSVLIEFSQQECNKTTKTFFEYQPTEGYQEGSRSDIWCAGITAGYELHDDIFSKMEGSVESVTILKSTLPKLRQHLFRNINLKYVKVQANVEIVESKIFENSNISSITLDFNNIKTIGDNSFHSSLIQFLSLQNNSLNVIKGNNFLGLTGLKKLNLKCNRISDIEHYSFDDFSSLEELDLSDNELVDLHHRLFEKMVRLKYIYLNNNFLKAVDDMFSKCKSLIFLYIQNNHITKIDTRNYPTSLLHINASHNHLTFGSFRNLVRIYTIDVSFNKLTLISGFDNLPALEYLCINYNSLGPFISLNTLNSFHNLFALELNGNALKNFSFEMLNNLTQLNRVELIANNLTHLDFTHFRTHLRILNFSKNSLTEIKNLTTIQKLRELDLNYNKLQVINYDTFGNMPNLEELYLGYNSIHTLHIGCFRGLKKLLHLHLCHNKITNIEIGTFAGTNELITLDISHNYLSHLDEHIFHNMRNILLLDMSFNNLNNLEIKNVLKQVNSNLKVNLIGSNSWTCKSLVDIVRNGPNIQIAEGTFYNVTNIYGIPCNNTDTEQDIQPGVSENIALYLDSIEQQSKEISSKTTVFNFFLAVLLITLLLKICFDEWSTVVKRFTCNKNVVEGNSLQPA